MKTWNWDKNNELGLNPEELTCGSNKKAWWICDKGHEWEARIGSRNNGRGCPCCSGRYFGDKKYIINNKKLIDEWNWDKNNEIGLNPEKITCGSQKKVWWLCDKGHEWEAVVYSRNSGRGCPYCSNKKVLSGYNDLATTNPELATQWHYDKNGDLTPKDFTKMSGKKVWWTGECGHEWEATIADRSGGSGCPYCAKETRTSFAEQAIYFYCKKYIAAINRYTELGKEIDTTNIKLFKGIFKFMNEFMM